MNQSQFKIHVAHFKDVIYSHAYYFMGNAADAADITQEVLIKLWHHFEKIPAAALKSWVFKVTQNACIDFYRQQNNQALPWPSDDADGDSSEAVPADKELNPETVVINLDLREHIMKAIQRLPPLLRHVIIMREIHNLKYEEIAASLDIPLNSVKVYVHRGRKLLCRYLKALYS
ncbi:MAG: RNA polymerase sigma factor [candidate division KSB1 bacterium]|nr:RNA polymerase sigma factor [candidate division KSB1 bacterium]MDZ7340091.1 RNA polymerase sigma factor [candidate division KSB1 bacterium]